MKLGIIVFRKKLFCSIVVGELEGILSGGDSLVNLNLKGRPQSQVCSRADNDAKVDF